MSFCIFWDQCRSHILFSCQASPLIQYSSSAFLYNDLCTLGKFLFILFNVPQFGFIWLSLWLNSSMSFCQEYYKNEVVSSIILGGHCCYISLLVILTAIPWLRRVLLGFSTVILLFFPPFVISALWPDILILYLKFLIFLPYSFSIH